MIIPIPTIKSKAALIAAKYNLKNLYLIGSYAHGTAKESSDIDLMYEAVEGFSSEDLAAMLQEFTFALGKEVELVSIDADETFTTRVLQYAINLMEEA